jgi:hypothetical protein
MQSALLLHTRDIYTALKTFKERGSNERQQQMQVVGVCGLPGCGKDALASVLVDRHGFVRLSFASRLKDAVACVFGWDRGMLEGLSPAAREARERPDAWWAQRLGIPDFSPRRAMQLVGSDAMRRGVHPEIWLACMERDIDAMRRQQPGSGGDGLKIVIPDCRFPNELDMITRRLGGRVVHVVRRRPSQQGAAAQHASETAYFEWLLKHDHLRVPNDGSLDDLATWCQRHFNL